MYLLGVLLFFHSALGHDRLYSVLLYVNEYIFANFNGDEIFTNSSDFTQQATRGDNFLAFL